MPATISWFEVRGRDADKLRSCYKDLFERSFQLDDGAGSYATVAPEPSKVPGVGAAGPDEMDVDDWSTFYVDVPDVAASIERARALGGRVLLPATALPDTTIAVIADPEGHPVGLSGPA